MIVTRTALAPAVALVYAPPMTTRTTLLLATFAVAALSACGAGEAPVARSGKVVTSGTAQIGGPYTLVDQTGATRTEADFVGKPQLIYFGFASCPDVCPAALTRMGAIANRVDPQGEKMHYILFTVDPERDTPEALAPYVESAPFPPGLVGLTGERENVQAAIDAYRIYASKREVEGMSDYLYDHSDYIIVMDETGAFSDIIGPDESVDAAAAELKRDFRL